MQSYELLKEVLKTTSAKQISSDLNLSLSLIYKWTEKPDGDAGRECRPIEPWTSSSNFQDHGPFTGFASAPADFSSKIPRFITRTRIS